MDHSEPTPIGDAATALLQRRARRAYEIGRWRAALRQSWIVVPMVALVVLADGDLVARCCLGGALFVVALLFGWRGGPWGRAVLPGLLTGAIPMLLPMVAHASENGCAVMEGLACSKWCLAACVASGVLAGSIVGYRAARVTYGRSAFVAAAGVVATLTGSLGCVVIGTAGLVGLVLGFGLAALPVLAVATARRA